MGLNPSWVTQDGLFAITTSGGEQYINLVRSPLNTQIGVSLSSNKYLARRIMERHGLPNIPYALPQTPSQAKGFLDQYGTIIVKPIGGAGSRDIHIVTAMRELEGMDVREYIFEKYVTGKEMRYLVLNSTVIGVHRSEYGTSVDEHRDLQRISFPQASWDTDLVELSIKIASILGLGLAAVDYLIDDEGVAHILEVNSAPGLKWFHAPSSGPTVDVARLFLEAVLEKK